MRNQILVPAMALAGLFLADQVQAQPFIRTMPHAPVRVVRTVPPPVVISRAPAIGIGINVGLPINPYPIYQPPVIIVDPIYNHYRVVLRASCNEPWRTYRIYPSRRLAFDMASELRYMGYEARVFHD